MTMSMNHSSTMSSHFKHDLAGLNSPNPGHSEMMSMYFHFGKTEIILFHFWSTNSWAGMLGSCSAVLLMAVLYEGLKVLREHLLRQNNVMVRYNTMPLPSSDEINVTEMHKAIGGRMLSCAHVIQTVLHIVQVVMSYFLMLIFMTYNIWLCLSVACGAGVGYFLFSWRRAIVIDINEHCH